jgi:transcription-repair coupling factor (superfamily II helicase)
VDNLLNIIKIKQKLIGLGIESVNIGKNKITYKFKKENNLLINNLIELVTNLPKKYKILPDMKLVTNINDNTWINVIKEINNLRSKIC